MQICIKVIQSIDLFETLTSTIGAAESWANRFFLAHGVACRVEFSASALTAEDLLCFPDSPSIVVAEVHDPGSLSRLSSLGHRLAGLIKENDGIPLMATPFIAVLGASALSTPHYELPEFVSDWVLGRGDSVELTHRILQVLRLRKLRKIYLSCGELLVVPELRTITLGANSARLSPAEFSLAELFFARLGSVVSLGELNAFFKAAGKSTEPNNIRVTIHQLRLKLEELSKNRLQLSTIYRKGYCLRQNHRNHDGEAPGLPHVNEGSVSAA
jgi:DNA-binding winged helix-turn-helix (wHTH) protein